MKYNKKILTIILSAIFPALFLNSCSGYLDCNESDYYDLEEIQGSFKEVKKYATNVYSYLPADFCSIDGAMLDAASDDALHLYEQSNIQRFVNGTWAANRTIDNVFKRYYNGIHDANFYLENLTGLDFPTWENNPDYENWYNDYVNYENEVRFLRAYFYFELVRRYKNIPLITNVIAQEDINNVQCNTYNEIFDFIITECSEVAKKLPNNYDNTQNKEYGRITKSAALALKARAALYLASPLYNENKDVELWKNAAKYAYEIISNASELGCGLDDNFSTLFGPVNQRSKEVLLYRPTGKNNHFESKNFPFGVKNGNTSTCPSENLASAFEMKDGTPFDWDNPAMKANPYANRDPRFYQTIVHNGMKWPADKAVEIYEGGANGQPLPKATTTGYYLRKYVNNDISFEPGAPTAKAQHNWVLFRYAEILLNYAEAMVNAFDDINYKGSGLDMSALEAINLIRQRKSVNMPNLSSSLSTEDFIKKLKNERRVELAFEGHRFWDLRRWKELDANKTIYGVSIIKNGISMEYNKIKVEDRTMEDKMYFYPFTDVELSKNHNIKQNYGW